MNIVSKSCAVSLLSLIAAQSFAVEPAEGWYAGFSLGPSWMQSHHFTLINPLNSAAVNGHLSYDIGINIAADLGFRCNKFRYEAELNANGNKLSKLGLDGIGFNPKTLISGFTMKGNTNLIAGLFNVYYELYNEDNAATKWVPYLGLGLGYARISNSIDFYNSNNSKMHSLHKSKSANAPVAQAMAGINYFFTDRVSFNSDFRYVGSQNIKELDSSYSSVTWNFGMNFSFDGVSYS